MDITPGSIRGFAISDKKIAIANVNGNFYAIEDRCPHQNQPLSQGMLFGNTIMCLFHGAQFDVSTGRSLTTVSKDGIKTLPVRVEGEDILVDV